MKSVVWRPFIALCLVMLLMRPAAAQPPAPLSAAAERIRDRISRIPIGGRMTVKMLDGRELHGHLAAIDPETFELREVDLKTRLTIRYEEVAGVENDYGGKGFGGRRLSPRRSRIVFLILVAGLLTVLFVALAADRS